MSFKICVLLFVFILFHAGTAFVFDDNSTELSENHLKEIQDSFDPYYPQVAIDKYLCVIRQQYSKVPEERKEGNFEAYILLIEGVFFRIGYNRMRAWTDQGYTGYHFDVKGTIRRIEEESTDEYSWNDFTQERIDKLKEDLAKEFPVIVVQILGKMFTNLFKAKTTSERKMAAISLSTLSMDGARVVVTSREREPPCKLPPISTSIATKINIDINLATFLLPTFLCGFSALVESFQEF